MKSFPKKILVVALAFITLFSSKTYSCSAFMLKGNEYCLVGFNENWKTMPGMIVVNNRGVKKRNLSWDFLSSVNYSDPNLMNWNSKYGSVSFNLLGYDLPCFGINEKGLFVVELYLEKTTPIRKPNASSMFWGQWIQYQIDNFATTDELVKNLNQSPIIDWWPSATGSHFFISDANGNTAAIELLDGQFKVTQKGEMPIPLLCNEEYSKDLASVNEYDFRGGSKSFDFEKTTKWDDRFLRAAYLLDNYKTSDQKPLDYSWKILDAIYAGEWQMVADIRNRKIYFRSDVSKQIKAIDINRLSFAANSKTTYLDIHTPKAGNVNADFAILTPEINQQYVLKGFPVGYDNIDFPASEAFLNIQKQLNLYVKQTISNSKSYKGN